MWCHGKPCGMIVVCGMPQTHCTVLQALQHNYQGCQVGLLSAALCSVSLGSDIERCQLWANAQAFTRAHDHAVLDSLAHALCFLCVYTGVGQ